tara:strand:- start:1282 stop:1503 length:222 start_codon:yes stop_codon:yes gene_type:complete
VYDSEATTLKARHFLREVHMDGNLELAWTTIEWLALIGVMFGIVLAIVFGFAKLGFQYAPWIVAIAFLIWFFQ